GEPQVPAVAGCAPPVSLAVAYCTVAVCDGSGIESTTVNNICDVPEAGSADLASSTFTEASSLVIVPTPVPSAMVAPSGLLKTTLNVSSNSGVVSPLTWTVIVLVVSAGAKLSVVVVMAT